MTDKPLEIERKFLIRMPETATLEEHAREKIEIRQTYCAGNIRARRAVSGGKTVYIRTEKTAVTNVTRIEIEREITREEYDALLKTALPELRTVEKTRWCVPYGGHTLEIDVFPFWQDKAFCEAELEREDEEIPLPAWIEVIREVTEDPRYTNKALAREIPE